MLRELTVGPAVAADDRVTEAATRQRRTLRALWTASVLGGLGQSLAGTAGALLARQVGGSPGLAGLPQACLVAGRLIDLSSDEPPLLDRTDQGRQFP